MFQHWQLIEADLHRFYGVDVEDNRMLTRRTYRWLITRVAGLLGIQDSLLRLKLYPPEKPRR